MHHAERTLRTGCAVRCCRRSKPSPTAAPQSTAHRAPRTRERFNTVDADLRELNELNFTRFDAKLGQRLAELDAKWGGRWTALDAKLEQRVAETDAKWERRFAEL